MNATYNLLQLKSDIKNEAYEFSGYINFLVKEPKERVINAPRYKDKIVQLAIINILKEVYQPKFIYDTYACIDNKGTHACVKRLQYFMRKAKWQYGDDATIVKADIKKFFYGIVRDILKKLIKQTIKEKETINLINIIIDSADEIDILGMPLGNTISQLCANAYLNVIDQYCKRSLGLKYYVRYMDDIIIMVENKSRAKEVLYLLNKEIEERLDIKLNKNKSKIFPIAQGVNAIGFKIYPTHMLLRNESKKRIKQKLRKMKDLIVDEKLSSQKAEQILNSWLGHANQANSYTFIQSLLQKYDYIKLVNTHRKNGVTKKIFKIKKGVIENARNERSKRVVSER